MMDMYFKEEDNRAIEALVSKMEASAAEFDNMLDEDATAHSALRKKELAALSKILGPGADNKTLYELMKWKHSGKFVNHSWNYLD